VLLNDGTGHFSVLANALPPKPTPFEGDCLDIENYDLNRDGYEDLLLLFTKKAPAYYQGRWIQVLINNGDGTFHDETSTRYPQVDNTSTYFIFLHMVDIDGNGYLDVIGQVPFLNSNGNHKYLLADANGTLTDLPVVPIYAQCGCAGVNAVITFVDRNRDGHRDVWSFGSLGGFMDGLGVMHRVAINVSLRPNTGAVLPPGIPQSVVATQSIANRVQIAWKYVWGATSYQVWKSSSPSDTGSMIGTTTAVRFDDPAASSNAAYYYVRAVNSAAVSGASKTAVGKLAGAPQIQGQPQSQTIAPGQTATLTVTAVGSPALDYQWYSGDSGDTTNPIAGANADTLTTPALNQISKYWVRVSNAIGTATSRTASIAMAASPASLPVLTNVAPASAFTGNTAQLSLSGTNFVPGETSLFLSGGGSILGAVTITGTTTATATLILKPDATAGVRSITVKTPQGTSGPLNFTIGRKMSRQVVSQ
jgi:hypothetical protein